MEWRWFLNLVLAVGFLLGNTLSGQEPSSPDPGVIRVHFDPFPYVNDPIGADVRSRARLGELTAYVLRVYSGESIELYRDAVRDALSLGVGIGVSFIPTPRAIVEVREPMFLLEEKNAKAIGDVFPEGRLEIYAPPGGMLFMDIPLPEGLYFFEYSLYFSGARLSDFHRVHPNYPDKLRPTIQWGPPSVFVQASGRKEIRFSPTVNINGYQYAGPNRQPFWETTHGFRHWVEFLVAIGAVR